MYFLFPLLRISRFRCNQNLRHHSAAVSTVAHFLDRRNVPQAAFGKLSRRNSDWSSSMATETDLATVVGVDRTRINVVAEAVQLPRAQASIVVPSNGSPFALFVGTLEPRRMCDS